MLRSEIRKYLTSQSINLDIILLFSCACHNKESKREQSSFISVNIFLRLNKSKALLRYRRQKLKAPILQVQLVLYLYVSSVNRNVNNWICIKSLWLIVDWAAISDFWCVCGVIKMRFLDVLIILVMYFRNRQAGEMAGSAFTKEKVSFQMVCL